MSLKTFQNPAEKDSLFAYTNSDPLLKRLLTAQPAQSEQKPAPEPPNFYVEGKLLTKSEWQAWKRRKLRRN